MTKIFFFTLRRKNNIFYGFGENIFSGFVEKCVFDEKVYFVVLSKNTFLWVWRKILFVVLAGKVCF